MYTNCYNNCIYKYKRKQNKIQKYKKYRATRDITKYSLACRNK